MDTERIPLIMDVDTGTDDAIALIWSTLCKEKLDIKAYTTVAGNVPLEFTSVNTLNIIDTLGESTPVAIGQDKPLKKELKCAVCHGETGLGDVKIQKATRGFYNLSAVETIYDEAKKAGGKLQMLTVGPQTNLAVALTKYPDLKDMIAHVTVMGGAVHGGNMCLAGEFNMFVDPDAAKIVFNSGIPITMVGLDVTLKTEMPISAYEQTKKIDNKHAKMALDIFHFMVNRTEMFGDDFEGPIMHDALALAVLVNPSLVKTKKVYIDIETEGVLTRGMTVVDYNNVAKKAPNVEAAVEVDAEAFWQWMIDKLKTA